MKRIFVLLCATVLLSGCVRYDVTLTNATQLTNVPKPRHDKNRDVYIIKSGDRETVIPSYRIISIEPHQESKYKNQQR